MRQHDWPRRWSVGKRFIVRYWASGLWYVDGRWAYRSFSGAMRRIKREALKAAEKGAMSDG